jgi:sulfate adenylyltransferase
MSLIAPHGGVLKQLYLDPAQRAAQRRELEALPSWDLTARQLCDLEMLLCGAFSPLEGFLGRADYEAVCADMRLADGTLWPMPITLDVSDAFAAQAEPGARVGLRDGEGVLVAALEVTDVWTPDRRAEAQAVFRTTDPVHPGVAALERAHPVYLGGRLLGVHPPTHYDYPDLRDTPAQLRGKFERWGWTRIVAFQTRNPMHRAHQELTLRAARDVHANLLIHPVVGMTKPGDVDHYSRVRCYEHLLAHYPERSTALSLLGLAMRMGGPREALWHAIIRKNYGCTHFIMGRDHAGPGNDAQGRPFYGPYDAQELVARHQSELGIEMVPFKEMVYVEERADYAAVDEVREGETVLSITGTEVRRRLAEGLDIPEWFSYPEVVAELRRSYPPRHRQGFTVFFTGLSGSGKSTIANALMVKLLEAGGRRVTLLDGDLVRKHLSSELGFSREHRDLNIRRIGYVASEITKHGGVAICAPIAPYAQTRREVRAMVSAGGGFVEVYVATPIETCEARDRKGLYAKARAGVIKEFTGVSDPYEVPERPELTLDTRELSVEESTHAILRHLTELGYLR